MRLRILILSQDKKLYSTRRLIQAARARGHTAIVVNPLHCYMNITANSPTIHHKGKILKNIDAVIPRIAASTTIYGTAVLRQLEVGGVYTVNGSVPIVRARDKLRVHQLFAKHGIPMPNTMYAHTIESTDELIKMVGGAPLIIKLTEGAQGKGVVKVDTNEAAKTVINSFHHLNANLLVQEYIAEAAASDIRCFVIGDKVCASMMRKAAEGEFRANLHQGGSAHKVKLTPQERKLAVTAARLVGLQVAGVDIIRSSRGPLLLEVNSSPGLQGIEECSGLDVAGAIIKFIEKKPTRRKEY